jgi:hypothetical protein
VGRLVLGANGQNGDVYFETSLIGGTWTQREGIVSTLVPPERFGPFLATPEEELEDALVDEMAGAFGEQTRALQAWVCGYMEGAVCTGSGAAEAACR